MPIFTANKRVAVKPFQTAQLRVEVRGGLPILKQKQDLTELEVVFGCEGYPCLGEGWRVWVRGDTAAHQWSKEVYEVEGKTFVFIPIEAIVMTAPPR